LGSCRKIQKLKAKVQNKARVEGCIVEAQLVEEATNFLTLFFRSQARSIRNKVPRYDDGAATFKSSCDLGIFQVPGRYMSPRGVHELPQEKYEAAFFIHFDKHARDGQILPVRACSTLNPSIFCT
jgi:hypothetical protein